MNQPKGLKLKDLQHYALEPISYYMKDFDDKFWMGMHTHQYFEIMYVQSGQATLEIYDENREPKMTRTPVLAGQFILLDGFVFHRLVIEKGQSATIYNVEFEPRTRDEYNPFGINAVLKVNYANLFTETSLKSVAYSDEGYLIGNDYSQVEGVFQKLILLLTNGVESLEQACTVLIAQTNLFAEIAKCLKQNTPKLFSYIKKTNLFIQKNFQRKINVQQIADYVGLNLSYLQRQYKQHTGETLLKYINSLRIQKAASLLTDTNLPISHIAVQVGFSNEKQLNYAFKSLIGVTPSDYKTATNTTVVDVHAAKHNSFSIPVPSTLESASND